MAENFTPQPGATEASIYQIRLQGHLGRQWQDWFDGFEIILATTGETFLSGRVADQAALHGLLKKVRDLGLPLLSVNRVEPGQAPKTGQTPTLDEREKA